MRYFMDEDGNKISELQLRKQFAMLKLCGETESANFAEYVRNCTDKNGTLTEIRRTDVYDDETMTLTITFTEI